MTQTLISEELYYAKATGPQNTPIYPGPLPVNLRDFMAFQNGPPIQGMNEMREKMPVAWCGSIGDDLDKAGFWSVTRYADVQEVSKNTDIYSSQKGGILMADRNPDMELAEVLTHANYNNMICMDGKNHMDVRKNHHAFFTPAYVDKMRKKVAHYVTELLDGIAKEGKVDFVKSVSEHLPMFTLAELLGISASDRHKLARWVSYLEMAGYAAVLGPEESSKIIGPNFFQELIDAITEMFEFGRFNMENRRRSREEDLMSAIAWTELENALLRPEYLDGSWLLIVFAGNDTTRNSISGTMRLLTENPEQRQLVLNDPSLVNNMCDEAIRLVSPVMYMRRTTTQDTELSGQKIAEGEKVVMWYGAANRDPRIFTNPDEFDVKRENSSRHIAFGHGRHICLGLRLANMQLQELYKQLLQRFPDMHWDGEIEYAPNNFVQSIRSMGVKFTPTTS